MRLRSTTILGLSWLSGCAEPGPSSIRIVDATADGWGLVDVPRGDLDDLDRMSGGVLAFRIDSEIALPTGIPRDGGADADLYVTGGSEPRTRWSTVGDVAVAEDFSSLAMFTAASQLSRALDWYAALGVRDEAIGPMVVHYRPAEGTGNAIYLRHADAMAVLAPGDFEALPMAMNAGVLGHELGHRVVYWELWDGRYFSALEDVVGTEAELESFFRLGALDEGIADYFGARISGDPAYLGPTIPEFADARDLGVARTFDPAWLSIEPLLQDGTLPDPHVEGAVVASALWAVGDAVGAEVLDLALLDALRALTPSARHYRYALGDLELALIDRVGPDACPPLRSAYPLLSDRFDEVCP